MSIQPTGRNFLISGRVQGVFYRRFAQQTAAALAITGWASNLPDGRVQVQAFGTPSQLEQYQHRLKQGPLAAKVVDIEVQIINWEAHKSFQIKV